ncbi:hypothetical protein SUGI_0333280 [Cryptomeria japonica]|nr:hypothetical protein SUGI_0333280 [Cryptomeria japonica]
MSLALSIPSNRNCSSYGQPDRNSVSGFDPGVQFRETRSSYFLDVNLPGLRKEDIWLQMDNTRALLIRGQRYVQDMGMVGWTWHLIQRGSSRRRPFRIPNDVHVAAVTANFHQGALHVVMPKFRWNRFSPYQLNYRSNCNLQLQLYPPMAPPMLEAPTHSPQAAGRTGETGEFLCEEIICEGAADEEEEEEEKLLEIRLEMEIIEENEETSTVESQDRSSEQPQRVLIEELIEEKVEDLGVSACEDQKCESPGSDLKVEARKDIAAEEVLNSSGCETSTVSTDVDEKKGTRSGEEGDKECDHENAKTEITMDSGAAADSGKVESAKVEEDSQSQSVLRKAECEIVEEDCQSQSQRKGGLSYLFSSIAEIAARKFRRR